MKAAEVIREARNVLFEYGWHKGSYGAADGSLCILGAINFAETGHRAGQSNMAAGRAVARATLDHTDYKMVSLFNDAPETTFSDVIDLLDKAEKIAEAREAD